MPSPIDAQLLRVFVSEQDHYQGRPVYEAIVVAARDYGLSGATVLRGTLGYGADSQIHTAKILRISEALPLVVEIVDAADKIAGFLPKLDEILEQGLVTLEQVRALRYQKQQPD